MDLLNQCKCEKGVKWTRGQVETHGGKMDGQGEREIMPD